MVKILVSNEKLMAEQGVTGAKSPESLLVLLIRLHISNIMAKSTVVNSGDEVLPRAQNVDAGILETVFRSTTTSYKYLLAKSILNILRQKGREDVGECEMQFSEIRVEMLVNAWFPTMYFMLNLGKQDFIARSLVKFRNELFENETINTTTEARALFSKHEQKILGLQKASKHPDPIRYAIYRFLRPWFRAILLRENDYFVNGVVEENSRKLFHDKKPLYQIHENSNSLQLHPCWVDYLWDNMGIVEGWLDLQWLKFLQRRNPTVPSLSSKLWALPLRRESLSRQREYWLPLLNEGFYCIYTNKQVLPNDFELDHFLPWSWVGHNQLWNLVPVSKSVNSSKGMNLPQVSDISQLSEAHCRIIQYTFEHEKNAFNKLEDYTLGLNLDLSSDAIDKHKIEEAYINTLQPQIRMATDRGFSSWIGR